MSIRRVTWWRPGGDELLAHVRAAGDPDAGRVTADVGIYDGRGAPLVRLEGMAFQPIGDGARPAGAEAQARPATVAPDSGAAVHRLVAGLKDSPREAWGERVREYLEAVVRLPALLDGLVGVLGELRDAPFVLFGHSVGALVAFELTRTLRRLGAPLPRRMIVSGFGAPDQGEHVRALAGLPPERLVEVLRRAGGTPSAILRNARYMKRLLPVIRADLELCASYVFREEPPLPVPLHVWGGAEDAGVPSSWLHAWQRHTSAGCERAVFPGAHFYLTQERDTVAARIREVLRRAA